jgi:hypothetical protein
MKSVKIRWASNFTLQRTTGSRCSPLAAERARYTDVTVQAVTGTDGRSEGADISCSDASHAAVM